MYKILFTFLLTFSIFQFSSIQAASKVPCAPQLKSSLEAIEKIPEAIALIETVQKEGPFYIKVTNTELSKKFGAYWDCATREISVSVSSHRSKGELIGSILFELHNAAANNKLNYYDNMVVIGKINREKYVEAIERIEYENSLSTAKIADKGIKMGVIPSTARLITYKNLKTIIACNALAATRLSSRKIMILFEE